MMGQPGPFGMQRPGGGGGFLGTALATAAGVAGGMMVGSALANAFGGDNEGGLGALAGGAPGAGAESAAGSDASGLSPFQDAGAETQDANFEGDADFEAGDDWT